MYALWAPPLEQEGRTVILVSENRERLERDCVTSAFESLGPVTPIVLEKHGHLVGQFYYRVGSSYRISVQGVDRREVGS
jgi:dolichol-phosphate mannosyltransferase